MNLKNSLLIFALAIGVTFLQSCGDACDDITVPTCYTCADGNLTITDPCCNVNCPEGYICNGGDCVLDGFETVVKSGFISTDETWEASKIYQLVGKVVVDNGACLTIEAGTIIKGSEGVGTLASALVIARGGKIKAMGTAAAPIVMTTTKDNITPGQTLGTNLDETNVGEWGGLIVLGYAPISAADDSGADLAEAQIEGIPADDAFGLYGGNDASDNSGEIYYLSVRHGGALIGANNEINGITLGGVGNGTVIENVEVVGNKDDGIECFGGTVNITNALVWAQGDDAFDIDQAYAGTINNFMYIAGTDSDHGLEIDGPEGSYLDRCIMTNGTMKGLTAEYADFRDGARGDFSNIYWYNFTDGTSDLELDDNASSANYFSGELTITGNEFNSTLTISEICDDKADAGDDTAFDLQMESSNSKVSTPTNAGADTSVFDWTMASEKGVI